MVIKKHPILILYLCVSACLLFRLTRCLEPDPKNLNSLCDTKASNEIKEAGCRTLPENARRIEDSDDMMVVKCITECWKRKWRVAMLKKGRQCFCTYGIRGVAIADTLCAIPCRGASKQMCGGRIAVSVFETGYVSLNVGALQTQYRAIRDIFSRSSNKKTAVMSKNDGKCVNSVPKKVITFKTKYMTIWLCVVHCYNYKHVYALTSNGTRCTCTSRMPSGKEHFAPGKCAVRCAGDISQMCGGKDPDVYSVTLTGYFFKPARLLQKDFVFIPALWQKWNAFLYGHLDVWSELLQKGIDLLPGETPSKHLAKKKTTTLEKDDVSNTTVAIAAIAVGEDVQSDAAVEEELNTEDAGSGTLIGATVGSALMLGVVVLLVVLFLRSKKSKEANKMKKKSSVQLETTKLVESDEDFADD